MKKFFLLATLCCLSVMSYAQEEKPESNKTASPEMTALQTAASLAKYGYANYSPTALIEAAKIFAETPVQAFEATKTSGTQQTVTEKSTPVNFTPSQLIADAKKYAGKDKVVLAYAAQVEKNLGKSKQTRGALGGPKYAEQRVYGKDYDIYQVKFWASELAEVVVVGDGDNDLDLYIYDQNGNLIASDTDYTDQCVCRWVPSWTGAFTVKIVNRGAIYSNYVIATN